MLLELCGEQKIRIFLLQNITILNKQKELTDKNSLQLDKVGDPTEDNQAKLNTWYRIF